MNEYTKRKIVIQNKYTVRAVFCGYDSCTFSNLLRSILSIVNLVLAIFQAITAAFNAVIGSNSVERYEVNAYGRRISQLAFQKGDKGQTIKLTIDTKIQELTNELLKEKAGSICVMDISKTQKPSTWA